MNFVESRLGKGPIDPHSLKCLCNLFLLKASRVKCNYIVFLGPGDPELEPTYLWDTFVLVTQLEYLVLYLFTVTVSF